MSTSRASQNLNKKIPRNPRYEHVKRTVDTGASVTNYAEKMEELNKNYKYRKDEIFRRMKCTTFVQLLLQVADLAQQEEIAAMEADAVRNSRLDNEAVANRSDQSLEEDDALDTSRSTLQGVIKGFGEVDIQEIKSTPENNTQKPIVKSPITNPYGVDDSSPFLLLDVRNPDSFRLCHIVGAKNYPTTLLSRSCNYFSKEILVYKNKPGKIIILYDEDETVAPQTATTFVQREVDNVFILSGGMKVLYKKFPEGMIRGTLPASCQPSPPTERRAKKTSSSKSSAKPGSAGMIKAAMQSVVKLRPIIPGEQEILTADDIFS
ncbi:Centrosomal protein of 41 kDa [Trichoplax sp. H2]|nr:Centrosomal protein of 41 kDa [Trichoplax sp. H2]|eukprot:RDD36649.1 Centrosomal protein of 41 kDa [Trichoplax sp. H2]